MTILKNQQEDSHITFETAALAKAVGFDWNSKYYFEYQFIGGHMCHDESTMRTVFEGSSATGNRYNIAWADNENRRMISAPKQSVLQKWLREVRNMSVEVESEDSLKSWGCYIIEKDNSSLTVLNKDGDYFNTYEEALEDGLFNALLKLPIVHKGVVGHHLELIMFKKE